MPRIGLIGCGAVADFGHIPAILATPGLDLIAIYDPNPERLTLIGDKYRIAGRYSEIEAFFGQGLDAVVICSPAPTHLANAKLAAAHGCAVLCEKPLAATEEDSVEIAEAMKTAGKPLYTAFVYRFSPVAQQIRTWIREKTVGDIRSLRLIYDWDLHGQFVQEPDGQWTESRIWRGRMLEGGPMVDCGVHQIDLSRWWFETEVTSFTADGAWVSDYEAPDHIYTHLHLANGALSTVEMSFTFGHTMRDPMPLFSYQLIGTGGILHYERDGYILEARTGSGVIRMPGASEKNFPAMHAAFLHALESGDPGDLGSAEDGIIATRIATEATAQVVRARKAAQN